MIKRFQVIARTLLLRTKLPISIWGHAILHAAALIRIRPTAYHQCSPLQLVFGHPPDISHLYTFRCVMYIPIAPTHRTKLGPQRRLRIYISFDSPSIIKYLEPLTDDLFTTRFVVCHFDETNFLSLGKEKILSEEKRELSWKVPTLAYMDSRTPHYEHKVRRIIHL